MTPGGAGAYADAGASANSGGSTALGSGGSPGAAGLNASAGETTLAGTGGLTAGAGSGGTAMLESPPGFFNGGYLTSTPWMGWVFTYADSAGKGTTVSPVCDSSGCVPAWGAQACLQGTVGKDPTSATFVGLAFHNINPMGGDTGTWSVTGSGIYISLSTPPDFARVQLQEPNTTSNDQRYCAPVPPGGTGLIPFSSFETYCWGDPSHPSKVLSIGTPIHETAIVVPGNAVADVSFSYCLVDIAPR